MARVVTGHYGGYEIIVVAADHSGHSPRKNPRRTTRALRAMARVVTGHYGGLRACPSGRISCAHRTGSVTIKTNGARLAPWAHGVRPDETLSPDETKSPESYRRTIR